MPRPRHIFRKGFTLLEVLLALSLFVLLAALAWPYLQGQLVAAELPESASRLRSLLYLTRSSAMLEHRRHRVRFSPKDQQPIIEFEPDPIVEPGRFVPVEQDWNAEPPLLADVQVHGVTLGRPVYMRPVSAENNAAAEDPTAVEPVAEEPASGVASTAAKLKAAFSDGAGGREAEVNQKRPTITFEADGSTDWATLVVSRVEPKDELPEDEPQFWVVLDGRTGLAIIRDAVTQAQLDDPTIYVQREKLEIPDTTAPEDMTLNIPDLTGATQQEEQPSQDLSQGDLSGMAGQAAGQLQNLDPSALQGDQGQVQNQDPTKDGTQVQEDAMAQLERELANSPDLSDEEKEEIRKSFREGQANQQNGTQEQSGAKSP